MNCHFCSHGFSLFDWVMRPSVQKLGALQSQPREHLQSASAEPRTEACTVLPGRVSFPDTWDECSQCPLGLNLSLHPPALQVECASFAPAGTKLSEIPVTPP